MRKNAFLFFLLLLSGGFCWGLYLPDSAVEEIRQELKDMRAEVQKLRISSGISMQISRSFQEKCSRLERELEQVSLSWEKSEGKVVDLSRKVAELQMQLDGLKAEYAALRKSWQKQKRKATAWKAVAAVSSVVVLEEIAFGLLHRQVQRILR